MSPPFFCLTAFSKRSKGDGMSREYFVLMTFPISQTDTHREARWQVQFSVGWRSLVLVERKTRHRLPRWWSRRSRTSTPFVQATTLSFHAFHFNCRVGAGWVGWSYMLKERGPIWLTDLELDSVRFIKLSISEFFFGDNQNICCRYFILHQNKTPSLPHALWSFLTHPGPDRVAKSLVGRVACH